MWTVIVGALSKFFDSIPKVLDFLKMKSITNKHDDDKDEREQDIIDADEETQEIEEIVDEGAVDDINDKFGWDE
jgi:hypothetical protein|tara:strand:- start:8888 stop:9109 length:222 start_codon:yes stop_codon:yes gene_type:complete